MKQETSHRIEGPGGRKRRLTHAGRVMFGYSGIDHKARMITFALLSC